MWVEVTLSGAGHSETHLLCRIHHGIWVRAIISQCGSGRGGWPHTKYQMRIAEILNELTFMGSPCTKDCSGHKAGYEWSLKRGGKNAVSHSNSFNNGAAIGVQQATQRPQGGGTRTGYTSQTVGAIRRRQQRLAMQQAAQAAAAVQQPPQV